MPTGGCFFADSCARDARHATIFWRADICPAVLRLHAHDVDAEQATGVFHLRQITLPVTVLRYVDGLQHVLIGEGAHALQLAISGADLRRPVHLVLDAICGSDRLAPTVAGLQRLNRILAGPAEPAQRPAFAGARRLAFVLRVLDARLAGASYRDIATVLFGAARVQADWPDPHAHLRDRLRRAARRGQELVAGGYRRLLC